MKFNVKIPVYNTYTRTEMVKRYGEKTVVKVDRLIPSIGYVSALNDNILEFFASLRVGATRFLAAYYYQTRDIVYPKGELVKDFKKISWVIDHYKVHEGLHLVNKEEL